MGVLALLAIVGIHLWDELSAGDVSEPSARAGWSAAARSYPAFAVSQFYLPEKTETYRIFRHPGGGRKDVFRWTAQGEKPVAGPEIYISPWQRLILLTAGNEPELAELFARAELKRGSCACVSHIRRVNILDTG